MAGPFDTDYRFFKALATKKMSVMQNKDFLFHLHFLNICQDCFSCGKKQNQDLKRKNKLS